MEPPRDNGAIIRGYRITRSDGATRTLTSFAGTGTAYTWSGLDPNKTYRFSVRALNEAGSSGAATTGALRPLVDTPSAAITSPARGATVSGVVSISMTAAPNSSTKSPILYVDGTVAGTLEYFFDDNAPFGPFHWDTRALANGTYRIELSATDQAGKRVTVSRTVTVANPARTVTITSPTDGAIVGPGEVSVTYGLAPTTWDWQSFELWVDDNPVTWSESPGALTFSTGPPGSEHNIRVRPYDSRFESYDSAPITITVTD